MPLGFLSAISAADKFSGGKINSFVKGQIGKVFGGGSSNNKWAQDHDSTDPYVWHDGVPFDRSKSRKQNTPLYNKVKNAVMLANKPLYDAFESWKAQMGRDPKLSEYKVAFSQYLTPSKIAKVQKKVAQDPITTEQEAASLQSGGIGAVVTKVKNMGKTTMAIVGVSAVSLIGAIVWLTKKTVSRS